MTLMRKGPRQAPGATTRNTKRPSHSTRIQRLYTKLLADGAKPVIRENSFPDSAGEWIGANCPQCQDGCRAAFWIGLDGKRHFTCPGGCHWTGGGHAYLG